MLQNVLVVMQVLPISNLQNALLVVQVLPIFNLQNVLKSLFM